MKAAGKALLIAVNEFETNPFDALACSNVNAAWGALTMEVLARLGIETVVISPGSRSTPLSIGAIRNAKLDVLPVLDERSAAFIALGIAKRSRKPAALVCTSGSAAANYFPAVVEASMSGTPLLILTADRPSELRDCSSGQTIDQIKLFGGYARHFVELALPEANQQMLAYLRQTLVHAVDRTLNVDPGPVHLNFPFRDPLAPDHRGQTVIEAKELEAAATVVTRPCEAVRAVTMLDQVGVERLSAHSKGIIVVGDVNPREGDETFADAIAMLSEKLGWPVFADALNPLRNHAGENPGLVCHYDALLRRSGAVAELRPTAVLQVGSLPTSKVLRAWLKELDATNFLLVDRPLNTDPLHRHSVVLHGEAHVLAEVLLHQRVEQGWLDAWIELEQKTACELNQQLATMESMFEGKAAWLLSQHAPLGSTLMFASSMSVRYAEWFCCAGSRAYSIFSNRGANGIDGTLGTAMGVAHNARPTILLTGDLAFLHDSNALLAAKDLRGSLTVVLINNNGGGIFEHLPVVEFDGFEDFFATPQQVKLDELCAAHGVAYTCIQDWDTFIKAIQFRVDGLRVLEIRTDRKADKETLQALLK